MLLVLRLTAARTISPTFRLQQCGHYTVVLYPSTVQYRTALQPRKQDADDKQKCAPSIVDEDCCFEYVHMLCSSPPRSKL